MDLSIINIPINWQEQVSSVEDNGKLCLLVRHIN